MWRVEGDQEGAQKDGHIGAGLRRRQCAGPKQFWPSFFLYSHGLGSVRTGHRDSARTGNQSDFYSRPRRRGMDQTWVQTVGSG